MRAGKADPKLAGAAPPSQPRALLSAVVVAVNDLAAALDDAGLNQRLRESPSGRLRTMDRSLPDETLDDLLVGCEAFAAMTAPAALATDDIAQLRSEAQRYLRTFQALADGAQGKRRVTLMGTTLGMTASGSVNGILRSGFSEPRVRDALETMIDALAALAALAESGTPKKRRGLIPIGAGLVIPVTVLGGAVALIVVLLASIALATGRAPITPNGLNIPLTSALATATPTLKTGSTPTARPGSGTPTAPSGSAPTPTPRPGASPTATPTGGYGQMSVSNQQIAPCTGNTDSFSIIYSGGTAPLQWNATWADTATVQLSPSFGTLQPNTSVTVTVTDNSVSNSGVINIIGSGSQQTPVTYDASGC